MSNLEDYARKELEAAGWFKEDGFYGDMMGHAVMKLIAIFSEEGHSGMSANIAVSLFEKLARFEPLTPLTGEASEWIECGDGVFQNRRCSRVFKGGDGRAYDIEGRIFREPDGACYTSRESRVYVEFPYLPSREYVDVPAAP